MLAAAVYGKYSSPSKYKMAKLHRRVHALRRGVWVLRDL
jgi:hypothetical protein